MKNLILLTVAILLLNSTYSQYQYLGTYTADGTPNYFVQNDVVSISTLNQIKAALPEGYPVPQYNPQYISSGYDTDIILTDSADVWVTFVDEGAGYKNVLGFYTYNINAPLTSAPPASAVTIIFPNVSKLNSGGSLVAGNKVKIGTFSANTGIGFILIADGWRNGAVSNGNWKVYSNPNFNPEASPSLKYHNALISDSQNQRVILGFEDIRRDYGSCDNDFNDALFYISASPYSAIQTSNYAPIESANASISSGNNGGLESNGRLAMKIAKRNFRRDKDNTNNLSQKENQKRVGNYLHRPLGTTSISGNLPNYFPNTGMMGNESPFESTPADLLSVTNATEVFSVDYYSNTERVAVGLATHTTERVYDHTKTICDRLNNSTLEDVRTVLVKDHKLINATLKNANGEIEYTITFSAQVLANEYKLFSLWNVEQFPTGEFLNFQVWGKSMGQVCSIVNNILNQLESQKQVTSNSTLTNIPNVYVKNGVYKNGKLILTICNKAKVPSITFNANSNKTETANSGSFTTTIPLNGNPQQQVEINTGSIFDIGFSISHANNPQQDGLYLADGAWGVDYDEQLAKDVTFNVAHSTSTFEENKLNMERNPEVSGNVKGTINLFRNTKAGNLPIDVSEYNNISFNIQSNKSIEVVLVSNDLTNWDDRARFTIAPTQEATNISIPLTAFTDKNGKTILINKIKTIVFSVAGDYQQYTNFNLKVSKVNFNKGVTTAADNMSEATVFPNPFVKSTTIVLPTTVKSGKLQILDAAGKLIFESTITTQNGRYILDAQGIKKGMYIFKLISTDNKKYSGKLNIQ